MATATIEAPSHPPTASSTVPDWLRLARAGAITMVVFSLALQTSARTIIPPVLVIGLAFLAFTPFLNGERRRVGIAAAAFGLLAYVANLPIILDDLRNPESAPAFILQLLSTAGVVLVVSGGVGAFLRLSATPVKPLALVTAGVFLAGTFGSIAAATGTESEAALSTDVAVTAQQIMWSEDEIIVAASTTGLWIENKDGVRHTFTIEALGVDVEIPALKARRLELDAPPGTYEVICNVPGHQNMTATLTIEG